MTVGDLLVALAVLSLLSLALCQACRDWKYPYTLHKAHKEPMPAPKQDDPYQNAKDAQATLLAQTIAVSILSAIAIALLAAVVSLCGF